MACRGADDDAGCRRASAADVPPQTAGARHVTASDWPRCTGCSPMTTSPPAAQPMHCTAGDCRAGRCGIAPDPHLTAAASCATACCPDGCFCMTCCRAARALGAPRAAARQCSAASCTAESAVLPAAASAASVSCSTCTQMHQHAAQHHEPGTIVAQMLHRCLLGSQHAPKSARGQQCVKLGPYGAALLVLQQSAGGALHVPNLLPCKLSADAHQNAAWQQLRRQTMQGSRSQECRQSPQCRCLRHCAVLCSPRALLHVSLSVRISWLLAGCTPAGGGAAVTSATAPAATVADGGTAVGPITRSSSMRRLPAAGGAPGWGSGGPQQCVVRGDRHLSQQLGQRREAPAEAFARGSDRV